MSELISQNQDVSINQSQSHQFRPLSPDSRREENEVKVIETQEKIYKVDKEASKEEGPKTPHQFLVLLLC